MIAVNGFCLPLVASSPLPRHGGDRSRTGVQEESRVLAWNTIDCTLFSVLCALERRSLFSRAQERRSLLLPTLVSGIFAKRKDKDGKRARRFLSAQCRSRRKVSIAPNPGPHKEDTGLGVLHRRTMDRDKGRKQAVNSSPSYASACMNHAFRVGILQLVRY